MNLLKKIGKWQDNSKVVAKNAVYAFIIKGLALVVSFFSTPLFIRYFNNNEVLGLWYTMLSILSWFLTFDLGIGNGIRNHLVKALAANDRLDVRRIISSGFSSVGVVTVLLTSAGVISICFFNLNKLFNINAGIISENTLRTSTVLVFFAIMLRFFSTSISSIYYALQRASVNNFLALCTSVLLFLYVLCFRFSNLEQALINISLAYLIGCNLPMVIAGFWVFIKELKDCRPSISYINRDATSRIISIGMVFFFCQVFFMITANSNEIFISHFWTPTDAADYSFYYRIAMLFSMLVSLALTPMWSMVTKAYEEKNFVWLKKLNRYFQIAGVAVVALEFIVIPFLQPIMNIWLGKGELIVSLPIAVAFAAFGAAFMYNSMVSTIVCGLAKMKLQLICYGIGSVFKIVFILWIAKMSASWVWVVWSNVIILVPYCIIQQISINKLFYKFKAHEVSTHV